MDAFSLLSFGDTGWGDEIAQGVVVTVSLALATLPVGLFIGFLISLGKQSQSQTMRLSANIYTTIFRGLPELLTLFLVYYGMQIAVQAVLKAVNAPFTFEFNSFVAGMFALAVVFSSYASEVFLSAFRAIPRGQYEGGYALGISHFKVMRLIIMPQVIKIALPGLANLWMILLKDTALVSAIGLSDIVRQTGVAARVTKQAFLFYGLAFLLFLLLALASSIVISRIERYGAKAEAAR